MDPRKSPKGCSILYFSKFYPDSGPLNFGDRESVTYSSVLYCMTRCPAVPAKFYSDSRTWFRIRPKIKFVKSYLNPGLLRQIISCVAV